MYAQQQHPAILTWSGDRATDHRATDRQTIRCGPDSPAPGAARRLVAGWLRSAAEQLDGRPARLPAVVRRA